MSEEIDIHKRQAADRLSQSSNSAESQDLIKDHEKQIWSIVRKTMKRQSIPSIFEDQDLFAWGVEGLLKAKKSFNPNKNTQFSSYAFFRIRGEILDQIRKEWKRRAVGSYQSYQDKLEQRIADILEDSASDPSATIHSLMDISAMAYILSLDELSVGSKAQEVADHSATPDLLNEKEEQKSMLNAAIAELPEMEQAVIKKIYWEEISQKETAELLKTSRSTVCRLHDRGLKILKEQLLAQSSVDFSG